MKRDLPGVFQNPIRKTFSNVQEVYKSEDTRSVYKGNDAKTILKKIDAIFSGKDFVYKKRVRITTRDGILEKDIVGKNGVALLTLDNQQIFIHDILDIEKI